MKEHKPKEKKINQNHINQIEDDFDLDVVSSTGSTGALYKPPLTNEDVKGYSDVYHVPQTKDVSAPTSQKKKTDLKNRT